MIARIWRGATRAEDAHGYVGYLEGTGLKEYRQTPGNLGAWVLWRTVGDRAEFVTLSFWPDMDAVRGFAGDDVERAVFYPEDDRWLVDRSVVAEHYQVVPAGGDGTG